MVERVHNYTSELSGQESPTRTSLPEVSFPTDPGSVRIMEGNKTLLI
jgi:hypothetical protein